MASRLYKYVEVKGLDELHRKLEQIPEEMKTQGVGNFALAAAAFALRDNVIARAPVFSGLLQENIIAYRDRTPQQVRANAHYSIRVRRIKLNRKVKRLIRRVRQAGTHLTISNDAYYWRFVEYGTSRIRAQGFFRRAIEATSGQFVSLINERLSKKLDAIIAKLGRGQ